MGNSIAKTQAMLAKHHRDGDSFAQLMKETFEGRFGDAFWDMWQKKIAPYCSDSPLVLDLGTGPGMFLRALIERYPHAKAVGVECAPYMLAAAESLPDNAEIITADLHDPHLPLEDNSADVAVASVVLHEMHQPVRTLMEVQRCLKLGGIFYILDWVRAPLQQYLQSSDIQPFDQQTPVEALEDLFVHFIEHNRFSLEDLVFMLRNTGFDIIETKPLFDGRQARLLAKKV